MYPSGYTDKSFHLAAGEYNKELPDTRVPQLFLLYLGLCTQIALRTIQSAFTPIVLLEEDSHYCFHKSHTNLLYM
jgi:hypothetical protein